MKGERERLMEEAKEVALLSYGGLLDEELAEEIAAPYVDFVLTFREFAARYMEKHGKESFVALLRDDERFDEAYERFLNEGEVG